MHRADPFMLDEDIAEPDAALAKPPLPVAPKRQSEQAPPPPPKVTEATPAPKPKAGPKAKRGRPKSANPKRQITLRLDAEIIDHYRAQGRGWQTRINNALREVIDN